MKAVLSTLNGKHMFHNFADGMTPSHPHCEKNLKGQCCGTMLLNSGSGNGIDGGGGGSSCDSGGGGVAGQVEYMVLSFGAWRFEPLQLERIVGLALALFMGHLAAGSVAAAFDPSWIINAIPAAPQRIFSLVEVRVAGHTHICSCGPAVLFVCCLTR
jgi:tRNA U38,U39,U40 pseudouridine synthase TruA